jgi:hypothetical protein
LVRSGASGTFFIVVNHPSSRRISAGLPEGEHGALKKSQTWPLRTSAGRPSWMILSWKLAGRSRYTKTLSRRLLANCTSCGESTPAPCAGQSEPNCSQPNSAARGGTSTTLTMVGSARPSCRQAMYRPARGRLTPTRPPAATAWKMGGTVSP